MNEYSIDCEECENTSYAITYEKPGFCPVCGRRAEIEKKTMDFDELDFNDE